MGLKRKVYALILASGSGSRFDKKIPKQFFLVNNKPILTYSISTFLNWKNCKKIFVSLSKENMSKGKKIIEKHFPKHLNKIEIIEGAQTRHFSSLLGLEHIIKKVEKTNNIKKTEKIEKTSNSKKSEKIYKNGKNGKNGKIEKIGNRDIIYIHDAARPLIYKKDLENLYLTFLKNRNVISSLATQVTETLVEANSQIIKNSKQTKNRIIDKSPKIDFVKTKDLVSRENIYNIKTPQATDIESLITMLSITKKSIIKNKDTNSINYNDLNYDTNSINFNDLNYNELPVYTDLISWAKSLNFESELILSNSTNIKITTKDEVEIFKSLLKKYK